MIEECVNFCSGGFELEGVLSYQSGEPEEYAAVDNPQAVLLCSPHPNLGGDMENNVILALAESLTGNGFITLRFNYRGVGASASGFADLAQKVEYWEGSMDTDNYQDFVADADSALRFLKDKTKDLYGLQRHIVGYSFGSILAMRVGLPDDDVHGVVCISTPFGKYDLGFAERSEKPKFFVTSDNDFAATADDVEDGYKRFSEPKRLKTIADCDHFYRDKEYIVADEIVNYL